MTEHEIAVLQAIAATAAGANGLFLFRFWRQSADSLFALLGTAFWLLALSWGLLAFVSPTQESRPYVYGIRLVAFAMVIVGIVQKNRGR
jgi:hypothetical protein